MDTDVYGPPVPPKFSQSVQSNHGPKHSDLQSDHSDPQSEDHSQQPKRVCSKAKKHSDKKKHKVRAKYYSQSSSSEEDQTSVPIKKSTKPQQAPSEHEHQQDSTDPVFYREVDMSHLPSQYAEEVETFRQILDLPDPRETLPRSSTTVLGLDDEKGQQELRPRGPSAMLPFSKTLLRSLNRISWPLIYLRVNISNPLLQQQNTTRWDNLVLKTNFRSSIQILPRSVFLLSPLGPLRARFPYKFSRNLNTKFGRISLPSISQLLSQRLLLVTVMETCQHSIKATFKRVKSQIQKGSNPERAARRGYENACDYFEIMNKRILIQQRALACLSKSVAHILQRLLYTMGNTGRDDPPSTTSRGL